MRVLRIFVAIAAAWLPPSISYSASQIDSTSITAPDRTIVNTLESVSLSLALSPATVTPLASCSTSSLAKVKTSLREEKLPSTIESSKIAEQIIACHWSVPSKAGDEIQTIVKSQNFGPEPSTLTLEKALGTVSDSLYVTLAKAEIQKSIIPNQFQITMTGLPLDYAFGYCLPNADNACIKKFLATVLPANIQLDAPSIIAFGSLFPAAIQPDLRTINKEDLIEATQEVAQSGFPIDKRFLRKLSPKRQKLLQEQTQNFYIKRYNAGAP